MAERFSMRLGIAPISTHELDVSVHGFNCERIGVAAVRCSPLTMIPPSTGVKTTRIGLCLFLDGEMSAEQDGRSCKALPGDLVMIDPSRPFAAEATHVQAHVLYLPKANIRALVPQLDCFTARTLSTASGAGAALRVLLGELVSNGLESNTVDMIADAALSLLASILMSHERSKSIALPQHKLVHRHRIRCFIRDNLSNPLLSPEMIAASVNLSRRYVYDLFENDGLTMMQNIRLERLKRCREELSNPLLAGRSIGEIASSWGFSHFSDFCRSFKKTFGCSPTVYRRTSSKQ